MHRFRTLIVALTMLTMTTAGCIGEMGSELDPQTADSTPEEAYDTSQGWSTPTVPPKYEILDGIETKVESFDGTPISIGVFLPDKEECDWNDSLPNHDADLPKACQLPVVMDAGPYWADVVDEQRYRPPLVEWLVPQGYAVVQMSVRGTGESGGCMEFMSMNEQRDVDEVVTWLGEAAWTNENVGMMGRSYDGTTPFMAAAQGNDYLKTIVPISGVASVPDLMFKNGTSETRGPIMHSVVYWAFFGMGTTYGADAADWRADHWHEQACEELVIGQTQGVYATATGDTRDEYWEIRDWRAPILENYNGSIWIVHGMQDWNVDPSQVIPWIGELMESDIETKGWLGQWAHHYPDRVDEHRNARWDWADETLQWFDYYLKEDGDKPSLDVEVEDTMFNWRVEDTYPPQDLDWSTLETPWDSETVSNDNAITHTFDPLIEDVRIAGLPQVHATVTPTTPTGGWLFAELNHVWPDGVTERIGWGTLDLRHHQGSNEAPDTLTPGQPLDITIQFEPLDAHVAQNHQLQLVLHKDGAASIPESPDPSPVLIDDATLNVPTIDRPNLLGQGAPPSPTDTTTTIPPVMHR